MSKKENALGSIPTFENVARATESLDLFTEEVETKEQKERKEKEAEARKLILAEAQKEKEQKKKDAEPRRHLEAKVLKELQETELEKNSSIIESSTKKGVRKGYKRQTFVIREDLLEMIQALSKTKEIMQVDLLEYFIEKGLAGISEEEKEKALAHYKKENIEQKIEKSKENITKLFN